MLTPDEEFEWENWAALGNGPPPEWDDDCPSFSDFFASVPKIITPGEEAYRKNWAIWAKSRSECSPLMDHLASLRFQMAPQFLMLADERLPKVCRGALGAEPAPLDTSRRPCMTLPMGSGRTESLVYLLSSLCTSDVPTQRMGRANRHRHPSVNNPRRSKQPSRRQRAARRQFPQWFVDLILDIASRACPISFLIDVRKAIQAPAIVLSPGSDSEESRPARLFGECVVNYIHHTSTR